MGRDRQYAKFRGGMGRQESEAGQAKSPFPGVSKARGQVTAPTQQTVSKHLFGVFLLELRPCWAEVERSWGNKVT